MYKNSKRSAPREKQENLEVNVVKTENRRTMIQSLNGIFFINEDWMKEPEHCIDFYADQVKV